MTPFLLHMLGIPGAGKTTFLGSLEKIWTGDPHPVLLGFDQVMQTLPGYMEMEDKIAAFAKFELPAREEGYKRLDRMIAERKSILFDNGGSAASHVDILKKAQECGYRIILVSITTSITAAQQRVDARSVEEGRHTPMSYLEDRAEKIRSLHNAYQSLTPHFYEIENNGLDFAVFEKTCYGLAEEILKIATRTAESKSSCAST